MSQCNRSNPIPSSVVPPLLLACAMLGLQPTMSAAIGPPAVFVVDDPNPCGVIRIRWTPVPTATSYKIFRNGTLIHVATGNPKRTEHLDYDYPGPGNYTYCIEVDGPGGPSPQVCDGASLPVNHMPFVLPRDWFQDVFPSDESVAPGAPAFARTTAKIVTGANGSECTGSTARPINPGTSVWVWDINALSADLVFRIKPGPGNYCVSGAVGTGLQNGLAPCVIAAPGDGSFWGDLMAFPGAFATPGAVAIHAAEPSGWAPYVWNSKPCLPIPVGFIVSLPDGIFTPGTHVEYFLRLNYGAGTFKLVPDTSCVIQEAHQQSIDGHRWEQFSVLPDLWKDAAFGGLALPCLLVVDLDEGRGNERVWSSIADTSGHNYLRGAGRGWRAIGAATGTNVVDLDNPAYNRRPDGTAGFIAEHAGSPGLTWDLYNVRGSQEPCFGNAGSIGSRLGVVDGPTLPSGPSLDMLAHYYQGIVLLTGDRSSSILGPLPDRSQDDIAMLSQFLDSGIPGKSLTVIGSGFAESEFASHPDFLADYMGVTLTSGDYFALSGNAVPTAAGVTHTGFPFANLPLAVQNLAGTKNDVLAAIPGSGATVVANYDALPATGPFPAAIYRPRSPGVREYKTLLQGWNLENLYFAGAGNTSFRRIDHYKDVLNGMGCPPFGPTIGVEPTYMAGTSASRIELRAITNPSRGGGSRLEVELAQDLPMRVRVFDSLGRLVRVVWEGPLPAGVNSMSWDGRDADGRHVAAGVYHVEAMRLGSEERAATKLVALP